MQKNNDTVTHNGRGAKFSDTKYVSVLFILLYQSTLEDSDLTSIQERKAHFKAFTTDTVKAASRQQRCKMVQRRRLNSCIFIGLFK